MAKTSKPKATTSARKRMNAAAATQSKKPRQKGRIKEYDVWNEAFHEPFIFNKCGWDLLDSAHVWAHRADPDARLFINEYNVVSAGETERLYDIVKGMLERKVPVHGIGVQCHFGDRQLNPAFITNP